jgi:oxygen-independent coproporphyrinogen-3 oxidase
MLEIDEDSRLGRELIAGGTRYHAHYVPDENVTASLYEVACEQFNAAGLRQYEISNFARENGESRHNRKYWTRAPYLGVGVDAHSMLPAMDPALDAVRYSTPDSLEQYVADAAWSNSVISRNSALEETFFLGLRLNTGIDLEQVQEKFGTEAVQALSPVLSELKDLCLLTQDGNLICLTSRGRMLSNEVFERFISVPTS